MVAALCEVCYRRPAKGKCIICGRYACEEHLVDGVCSICRDNMCMICGKRLAIGYCSICGRLGCGECLIQVDNVRRVCIDCLKKLGGLNNVRKILERKSLGLPKPTA